jgi:lipopolysaccharide transport system ATP-binding protein
MSSELAISVTDVSKYYEIYENPIDRLKQTVWRGRKQFYKEYRALDSIRFQVKKGETIGIVGSNGAGKSTLLQIICGTLAPTKGEVNVNGRVAALLELGAGFNPEFTGRENVYMAASILGLTIDEIDDRYRLIVEFADIGEFIDRPIKTYSSGMYVRLAFAVIAHVDADILVIDEALAVGDAIFTQKCMRYIRSFQAQGTLIFVSHDMSAVQNLCQNAVWLSHGKVKQIGSSQSIAQAYMQYSLQKVYGGAQQLSDVGKKERTSQPEEEQASQAVSYDAKFEACDNVSEAKGWKTGAGKILAVRLAGLAEDGREVFEGGETVQMVIEARPDEDMVSPILGFIVKDRLGQDLFGENTLPFTVNRPTPVKTGELLRAKFVFTLPMLPNGQYAVTASLADGDLVNNVQHHLLHDALIINVSSSKVRWGLVGVAFDQVTLEVDYVSK